MPLNRLLRPQSVFGSGRHVLSGCMKTTKTKNAVSKCFNECTEQTPRLAKIEVNHNVVEVNVLIRQMASSEPTTIQDQEQTFFYAGYVICGSRTFLAKCDVEHTTNVLLHFNHSSSDICKTNQIKICPEHTSTKRTSRRDIKSPSQVDSSR